MTASKSSRARNARAQASGARTGSAASRANRGGNPARTSTAVKPAAVAKSAPAAKTGTAVNPARGGVASRDGAGRANGQAQALAVPSAAAGGGVLAKVRGGLAGVVSSEGTAVPLWLRLGTFVLALAGLGASTYLTVAHFTQSSLAGCSETGLVDCTKVTTSPQSYVFGIPVAVLGLAFYVFMVAIMSPWAWRATRREVHLIRIGSVVAGMGMVLYLLYAELFLIGSICLYCTGVHVVTFLSFVLTVLAAAVWGLRPARSSS